MPLRTSVGTAIRAWSHQSAKDASGKADGGEHPEPQLTTVDAAKQQVSGRLPVLVTESTRVGVLQPMTMAPIRSPLAVVHGEPEEYLHLY
jgi:hypothetical protein